MSLFAGYAGTPSSSAYLEMWQDIQLNHIDWETWEYPPAGYKDLDELMQSLDTSLTDQEKQETAAKILMPVENRLRLMLGLAEASETADLWCLKYRIQKMCRKKPRNRRKQMKHQCQKVKRKRRQCRNQISLKIKLSVWLRE